MVSSLLNDHVNVIFDDIIVTLGEFFVKSKSNLCNVCGLLAEKAVCNRTGPSTKLMEPDTKLLFLYIKTRAFFLELFSVEYT